MGSIVKHNDPTTTGGRVFSSHHKGTNNSVSIARERDKASCGQCEGLWPIIATCKTMRFDGYATAQDLDLVACPCGRNRVIAGSRNMHYGRSAQPPASVENPPEIIVSEQLGKFVDEEYEVVEYGFILLKNGVEPAVEYVYDLFSDDAIHTHKGHYDSNGKTAGYKKGATLKLVTWIEQDSASKSA